MSFPVLMRVACEHVCVEKEEVRRRGREECRGWELSSDSGSVDLQSSCTNY